MSCTKNGLSRHFRGTTTFFFESDAHFAEFDVPAFQQIFCLLPLEFSKRLRDVLLKTVGCRMWVAVCAAQGFIDDRVDDAEPLEVRAGQPKAVRELGGAVIPLEQNCRAGFGAD